MEHILVDAGIAFGKPRIAGTRFTVNDVVVKHLHNGMPLELISADFEIPLASLYAAMTYYYDHKKEIDLSIEQESRFAEEFKEQYEANHKRQV